MSGLLLLPAVLVGASVLLFATTYLERVIGPRSDRWPLPTDINLIPLVVSADPALPSQPRGREEEPCTSDWERSC